MLELRCDAVGNVKHIQVIHHSQNSEYNFQFILNRRLPRRCRPDCFKSLVTAINIPVSPRWVFDLVSHNAGKPYWNLHLGYWRRILWNLLTFSLRMKTPASFFPVNHSAVFWIPQICRDYSFPRFSLGFCLFFDILSAYTDVFQLYTPACQRITSQRI